MTARNFKWIGIPVLMALSMVVGAACDSIGEIGGGDEPYRIGVMESVTGPARLTAMWRCRPSRWRLMRLTRRVALTGE